MMCPRSLPRQGRPTGKVLVMVAVSLPVLLGAGAMALDGGVMQVNRRHGQAAADAAAMAGAIELFKSYPTSNGTDGGGTARFAAFATAEANGFENDGNESVVTVNIPPVESDQFEGRPSYIEVIVQRNQRRGFSGIWGSDRIPVRARAVARGAWIPPGFGILTLDPTASPATNASGNGIVTVQGGGVVTNSNSSNGLRVTGGGSMVAENFDVAGSGHTGTNFSTAPTHNTEPTPDPLRYLPEPARPGPGTITRVGNTYTISPGLFVSSGNPRLPNFTNGDVVTFLPGIYYLEGGLSSGNGVTITGNGVMFFNAGTGQSNSINISGGIVTLTPPTSGIYSGITFFQARNSTQSLSISGGGDFNIDGTFYAPAAELKITGSSGTARIGSQYISRSLTLGGNGNIIVNASSTNKANQRLMLLVE